MSAGDHACGGAHDDWAAYCALVDDATRDALLTPTQAHGLRNTAASMAMSGMPRTAEELHVGAELAAGRIDFSTARGRLDV